MLHLFMCHVNELSNAFIILVSGDLGDNWQIGEDVSEELESFTCVLYGQGRDTSVNALRCKMLKKMIGEEATLNIKSKVDLARLPPCKDSLIPHIQRVNYRVACYKRAAQPNFSRPKPHDVAHGWQQKTDGVLEPIWSTCPVLPLSLVDLVAARHANQEDDDDGDGDEVADVAEIEMEEDNYEDEEEDLDTWHI